MMENRTHNERALDVASKRPASRDERNSQPLLKVEKIEMVNVEVQQSDTVNETPTGRKSEHFPVFIIVISIVQIILFFSFGENVLCMIFGYDPHRRHEIWRYITVMLVHSGQTHLWTNVVMQLVLGVPLEIIHNWKRMGTILFASVVGGTMWTTILSNKYYVVGASSGVVGMLFSHIATFALNWNEMDRKLIRIFCVSFYIVYDFCIEVYAALISKEENSICYAGHLGGAITGFFVSILVLENFKKYRRGKLMEKICIGILITLFLVVFVINVTAWDYFPDNEWNFDYEKSFPKPFPNPFIIENAELFDEN